MQEIQKFLNTECKKHRTSKLSSPEASIDDERNNKTTRRKQEQGKRRSRILLLTLLSLSVNLVIVCRLVDPVAAFNLDTQSAIVHHGPEGSYFGYTVAQHKDRGVSWLLVGAPKAKTDQFKQGEAGAVYRCSPSNSKACQQIEFDPHGSNTIQLKNETKQIDDKSQEWFGASLQSATENGSIVACAHKYVYFSSNLKRRDPVGRCFVSRGSFSGFLEYSPCRLNGEYIQNSQPKEAKNSKTK